jgi:aspartyl-tRNA(Asn)/glutamyl-tRNA(Gln) amidotransferase subunit B|tara:strand:- start:519 stop:1487 length:969 start_codon:yes stop_codon:yes gene_type:complete
MNNSVEAVAFAKQLHSIVTSIGICDGKMAQGSMRFDVNISVRPKGQEKLGTRTETKNLNSFKFMEEAIALEVERQIDILEDGGSIAQETRLYNSDAKTSKSMRSKEEANDYRYFPCPDLLPVEIDDDFIEAVRKQLPELPAERQARFVDTYKLSEYDASLLSASADLAHFFEAAADSDAKLAANWIMGEVSARLNAEDKVIAESPVSGEMLGGMIARLKDNTISSKQAKQVFEGMWKSEGDADAVIEKRGLKQVSDTGALEGMVDAVLTANAAMVEDYKNTDESKRKKKLGGFMGQIMKASKGQANPQMINQILMKKLNELM